VLIVAGVALLFNIAGAATAVTRRVTSRSLGSLAPGYAATSNGLRVYAVLVVAIGFTVAGLGVMAGTPVAGLVVSVAGAVVFVVASVMIIAGEVRTYRALAAAGNVQ
jgi:hypothetical protein